MWHKFLFTGTEDFPAAAGDAGAGTRSPRWCLRGRSHLYPTSHTACASPGDNRDLDSGWHAVPSNNVIFLALEVNFSAGPTLTSMYL